MKCENCGKKTPDTGTVCHWCGVDKTAQRSRDKAETDRVAVWALPGMLIGGVGCYALGGGLCFSIAAGFAGGFVGAIALAIHDMIATKPARKRPAFAGQDPVDELLSQVAAPPVQRRPPLR